MGIFQRFHLNHFNDKIDSSSCSRNLKLLNIVPVYKNDSRNDEKVSIS